MLFGKQISAYAYRLSAIAKVTLVIASAASALFLFSLNISRRWLFGSVNYADLGVGPLHGMLERAMLLILTSLVVFSFMSVMPMVSSPSGTLSRAGKASLSVYLLHGFIVISLGVVTSAMLARFGTVLSVLICLIFTVLTVALFTLPVFDRVIRWAASTVLGSAEAAYRWGYWKFFTRSS